MTAKLKALKLVKLVDIRPRHAAEKLSRSRSHNSRAATELTHK
eukprot:UN25675